MTNMLTSIDVAAFSATILPNPYYWAGNEPSLLNAFEFNVAGVTMYSISYDGS